MCGLCCCCSRKCPVSFKCAAAPRGDGLSPGFLLAEPAGSEPACSHIINLTYISDLRSILSSFHALILASMLHRGIIFNSVYL